ncbi:putative transmembrane protein, partial [Toxoplasma gondii MAS]
MAYCLRFLACLSFFLAAGPLRCFVPSCYLLYQLLWTGAATGGFPWQRPSPTPLDFFGSEDSFSLFSSTSPALPFPSANSVSPSEANVLGDAAASVAPASSPVSREAGERRQGAGPEFSSLSSAQSVPSTFADVATRLSPSFSEGENDRQPPGRAAPSNARLSSGLAAAISQEAGMQRRLPPSDSAKSMPPTWNDHNQGTLPASIPSPLREHNPFSSHLEGQHACGALFAPPRGRGSDRLFSQNEAEKEKGKGASSDNLEILVRNINMPHRSVAVGSVQVHLPVDRQRGSRTDSESSGDAETENRRNKEAAEKRTGEGSVFDALAGHREPQIRQDPAEASEEETEREVAASEHASVKLDISHFSLPTKAALFFRWGKPPTFVNYDLRLEVASPGTYFLPLVWPADGISPLRRSVECSSPSSPLASSSSAYSSSASFPASSSSLSSTPSSLSTHPSGGDALSSSLSSVSDVRPCACSRPPFASASSAVSAASPSLSEAGSMSLVSSFLPVGRLYYLVISCTVAELASYRQKLTPRGRDAFLAGTLSLSFHGDKFLRIFPLLTQDERENMDFSLDPGKNGNVHYFHLPSTVSSPATPVPEGAERAENAPDLSPLGGAFFRALGDSARRHGDAADGAERLDSVGRELSEAEKHAPDSVENLECDKRHAKVPQAGRKHETTSGKAEGDLSSNRDRGNRVASAVEKARKGDQEQGKSFEKEVDSQFTRFFFFAPKTLLQEVVVEGGEVEGRLDAFRDEGSALPLSPPSSLSRLGRTHPAGFRLRFPRKRVSPPYQLKAAPTFSFEWHQVLSLPPQVAAPSSSVSNPFSFSPSSSSESSSSSGASGSPPFPIACIRVNFSGAPVSTFQRENEERGLLTSLDTCSFFSEAVHRGGVQREEKQGDVLSEQEGRGSKQEAEAQGDARNGDALRRLSTQEMEAEEFSSVSATLSRFFDLRAVDILKPRQRSAKREGGRSAGEEKSAEGGRQTREWTFVVPQERLPEAIQKAAHTVTLSWRIAPLLVVHRETPSPARREGVGPQFWDQAAANKSEREERGRRRQTEDASVEKEKTPPQTEGLQRRELSGESSGRRGGDTAAGKHGIPLPGVLSTEGVEETDSEGMENARREEKSKERETERAVGGASRMIEDRRKEERETTERDTLDRTLFLLSQRITFDLPSRGPWAFTFYLNTTMPLERVIFSSESVDLGDFGSPQNHAALTVSSPTAPRSSRLSPAASVDGEPSLETFSKVPFFIRRHSCRARMLAAQCRDTSETAGAKEARQRQSSTFPQPSFSHGRGRTGERGDSGSRAKNGGFFAETSPASDVFSPTAVRFSSLFSGMISPILSLFSTSWSEETEVPQAPVSSKRQSTQSASLSYPVSPPSSLSSQHGCTSCPSARSSLLFLPLVSPALPSPSFSSFLILSSVFSSRSSPPSSLPRSSRHSSPSWCPCSRSSGVCDTWCATPLLSFSRPLLPIFQPNLLQSLALSLGPETAERPALAELFFSPSDVSGGVALLLKLDAGDIWRSPQFVCEEADWQQEEARLRAEREDSELVKKRGQKARQQEVGDAGKPGTQRVGDSREEKGDTAFERAEGGESQQQREEHELSGMASAAASDRLHSSPSQTWTKTDSRGAPFASQEARLPFERAAPTAGPVKRDLEAVERARSRQHASGTATEAPETDVVVSFFTVEFLLRREAAPFRRARPDELEAAKEETRDQAFNTHWGSATDTVVAHRWRLPFACRSAVAGGAKRGTVELAGDNSSEGTPVVMPVVMELGADEETDDVSRRRSFAVDRVRTDKREFADEVQERSSQILDTNRSRVSEDASSSRVSSLAAVMDSSLSGGLSASGEASSFSPRSPSRTFSLAKKVGAGVEFLYEATVAPSWNFRPGRHLASWRLLRRSVVVSANDNLKREINRFLMMTEIDQEANRDELQKYEARKEAVSETTFSQHEAQDLRWGNNSPGVFLKAQFLADEPCEQTCHRGHCWPLGFVDGFRLNYCRCTLGVGGAACDEELLPRWYVAFLTALLVFSNLAFLFVIRFSIRELLDSARPWETEANSDQGEETLSRARWKRPAAWRPVVRLTVFGTAMVASSMYHLCFDGDRCFVLSPMDWQNLDFLFSFFSILLVLVALSRLPVSLEFFLVGVSFAALSRATLATPRRSATVSRLFVSLSLLLLLRLFGAFPRRWKERRRQRRLLSPAAWRCRRLLLTAMARAIEAERA